MYKHKYTKAQNLRYIISIFANLLHFFIPHSKRKNGISVMIRVRDHGPGITPGEERRIFRPFCKSARQAAETAPGVGLGLALSRRLARSMGGELSLDGCPDGACFVLTLRVAHSQ